MPIDAAGLAAHFGSEANPQPPRWLGTRYDETGTFLPDPGNTVVCHLLQGSDTQSALERARRLYLAMDDADAMAFTAPQSLHMTLFQGILGRRPMLPYWPADMALDLSVEAMTALFMDRLEAFAPGPDFAVEVVQAVPTGLIVEGVTAGDRRAMADWRNLLADRFGYRHPDHDSYQFHITFCYPIRWIAGDRLDAWSMMLDAVTETLRRDVPVLELRAPAFCSFSDMNWFEELLVLDGSPYTRRRPA